MKFIFEGEEEIGSPSLEAFCQDHREMLKADVILVSDTSMLGADLPSLTTGLRGLAYWEIEVTGPNRDLHSGHFGGAVANPINVLCQMMSRIVDADGRITVPGFYDDVEEVPQAERDMIAHIPFDEEKYKAAIGVKNFSAKKAIAPWSETAADRRSTFAAFGADIPAKAPRQSCPPKLMPRFRAALSPIRTIIRFRNCLPTTSRASLLPPFKSK